MNMKLLSSSPSISSSSSTSSSFDPKMCTSKSTTAGCLTGILRRILCSGSLPTHPSDHIAEATSLALASHDKSQQCDKFDGSKVSPGIVARLMGLDSLPDISLLESQANPNSMITRSRSLNSADYKQDKIDGSMIHVKHRRVNSSLSFRDMPTYFELENEDYFVLSFEKESERKEVRSKKRREESQKDKEGSKRVLNVLSEEKLNRIRSVEKPNAEATKCRPTPIVSSKMVDNPDHGAKLKKKKKKTKHWVAQSAEPESSSEDSSPVSVLDFDQYIIDHDVPTTSEEDSSKADMDNYECKLSPSNEGNLMEDDQRVNNFEGKNIGSRIKVWHSELNMECWDSICRMSEAEVAKSSWLLCSKEEDLQEITADFGSHILDQLLEELVVQHFGSLP